MPTRIFEVRNLRIAVKDADVAAIPSTVAAADGRDSRAVTDGGEQLSQGWIEVIPGVSLSLAESESLALSVNLPQASHSS